MRRTILSIKTAAMALIMSFGIIAVQAQCTYTLNMFDSYGDGWNGGTVFVTVGGVAPAGSPFSAAGSGSSATFTAAAGDAVVLTYSSGSWEGENTYNLQAEGGVTIFSDGPAPATGAVFAFTNIVGDPTFNMFDSYGDGWNGGTINLTLNGAGAGSISAAGAGSSIPVVMATGDNLTWDYTSGSWEGENSYDFSAPTVLYADGPAPTTGAHGITYIKGCSGCAAPSALGATPLVTSASLDWTENGTATIWDIEWGAAGFTLGTGAAISNTGTNPHTLGGLAAGTSYDYYVRADCGGITSGYVGPFTFTTDYCTAPISAFPYSEDFESGAGGWADRGSALGTEWALGTPAQFNLNAAASGTNAWMTDLTANYLVNANDYVENCFDFGSLTAPEFGFGINYDTEANWDGGNVSFSTDAGATWTVLGAIGDPNNWYNDTDVNGFASGVDGWSGNSGGWITARHDMTPQAGQSDVRIRVGFGSDGSVTDEGFAFDDISIINISCLDPTAQTAANITTTSADLGWTENGTSVAWQINYGFAGFTLGGGATVSTGSNPYSLGGLSAGTSYDFYVRADCGAPGFSSWVGPFTFQTDYCATPISVFPYSEDFESGAGGWTDNGSSPPGEWALGTPAQTSINAAASGVNAWMTNLTANYQVNDLVYVENCFDYSSLTAPELSLGVNYDAENNWDGGAVEVSNDGGATFVILGAIGDPNNWYNNTDVNGLGAGVDGWSGNSGGWLTARHEMNSYAGDSDVRIRVAFGSDGAVVDEGMAFDDVSIINITCLDPTAQTATNITSAAADLGWTENGTSSAWEIEWGAAGFTFGTGATIATGTNPHTLGGLAPSTSYDFYVRTNCGINGFSGWAGPFTFITDYCVAAINTFPYSEDFESGAGGWTDNGSTLAGVWELGAPAQTSLNTANSPTNAWMTDLNANYANGQNVYVENCFDFTSLTTPEVSLGINYDTEANWDGGNVQYSLDGGGTWTILGAFGEPNNWYNDTDVNGFGGGVDGWSGNSGGWLTARKQEVALGGVADVRLRVGFGSDGIINDEGFSFDDFGVVDVLCVDPTAQTAINITSTSADLGWTENGTSSSWEIEYGATGFTLGAGATQAAGTNPYTLGGLTPGLVYDFYVRSDCGILGNSGWAGPFTFQTDYCGTPISTFPYSEDFESGAGGWTDNGSSPSGLWALGTPAQASINSAASGVNAWMTGLATNYSNGALVYVENCFDLTGVTVPVLQMAINYDSELNWDGSNVDVSTDGGATFTILGAIGDPNNWYDNTDVNGIGAAVDGWSGNSGGWITARHEMNAYAGAPDVRIRVAFGGDGSVNDEGMAFDDVVLIDETCPTPTDVAIVNQTETSFDVTFTAGTVGSTGFVEYGAPGFAVGTGTTTAGVVTTATTTISVSGLTSANIYDVYVYEDCEPINLSGPDLSTVVGPISTYTLGNPSACEVGVTIPDNGIGTSDFGELIMPVTTAGTSMGFDVELKEVRLQISHDWDGDVEIQLVDPTGLIVVDLSIGNGSFGANYGSINGACNNYTAFTMTAATNITVGAAPYIGTFSPEGDFADFNDGADPNGNWILRVGDNGNPDEGQIEFCQLIFGDPPGCPNDPSGVAISNQTTTSFDVDFTTANAIGTSYYVEYGAPGFVQGTGTVVGSVGNNLTGPGPVSVTISPLPGATVYDVYVYENCGTAFNSNVIGPIPAFTLGNPSACGTGLVVNNLLPPAELTLPVSGFPGEFLGVDKVVGEVKVLIEHTWSGDLLIELESPDGNIVNLSEFHGGFGDENYGDPSAPSCGVTANFRDDATVPLSADNPPYTTQAAYIPDNPMNGFNGLTNTVDGDWILRVTDFVGGDNGTLEHAEIVFETPPPCQDPQDLALVSAGSDNADFSFFSWNAADTWTLEYGPAGYTPGSGTVGGSGVSILGPANAASIASGLTPATFYDAYIMETCGGFVSGWVGPVTFATRPLNDECAAGVVLSVNPGGFCTSFETGSNIGATPVTPSGIGDPTCANYQGGDVWYKTVVPVSGDITITTNYSTPVGLTDIGMAVYDACGGTQLGCNDDGALGLMSELSFTGLTYGDTLYVRVWEYSNNAFGEFGICAFEPTTDAPPANIPCGADALPVGDDCNYTISSNQNATTDIAGSCTAGQRDVWWVATVPPTGALVVNTLGFGMTDATMTAHLMGDCNDQGTWTEVGCSDDEGVGLMPYLYLDAADGVNPGDEVYIRIAGWGGSDEGTYYICASRGIVWTGATNSNYVNEANWVYGAGFGSPGAPTADEHVVISPNATNPAVVSTGGAFADNMWVMSGSSISVNAGQTMNIAGNLVIENNASDFGDGIVAMNGTAAQEINSSFQVVEFGELMIDNAAGVSINQTFGGFIGIRDVLDVNNGDLDVTNGLVRLLSDASGTAYLDDWNGAVTSGTITGNITMERYIAGPGYHHISSPVNTPSLTGEYSEYGAFNGANNVGITPIDSEGAACADTTLELGSNYGNVFEWEENSPNFTGSGCNLWGWEVRSSGTLENGRGYAAQTNSPGAFTLRVTGAPNTSPVSYGGGSMANSGGDGNGFQLVGNPFAAPITWNVPAGFAPFAYAWNDGTGSYSSYPSGTINFGSHQGFFVQALGSGNTYTVDNTSKFEGDPAFQRTSTVFGDYSLNLEVSGNGFNHFTVMAFADMLWGTSTCTNGWDDMCDAYALPGNTGQPFMYSMTTEGTIASPNRLQYNTQTLLEGATRSVPMALDPGANGSFTITASDFESFPSGTGIVLEDLKDGIMHDLVANPTYTFTGLASDYDANNPTNRFVVHFSPASVTDIDNVININAGFYTAGEELIMQLNILEPVEGIFSVLNAVGQEVMSSDNITTINGKHSKDVSELANGVYIVRFVTEGETFSGKFVKH